MHAYDLHLIIAGVLWCGKAFFIERGCSIKRQNTILVYFFFFRRKKYKSITDASDVSKESYEDDSICIIYFTTVNVFIPSCIKALRCTISWTMAFSNSQTHEHETEMGNFVRCCVKVWGVESKMNGWMDGYEWGKNGWLDIIWRYNIFFSCAALLFAIHSCCPSMTNLIFPNTLVTSNVCCYGRGANT